MFGNKYTTNEKNTYQITSNDVNFYFTRIGNTVKVKVSTTIAASGSVSKIVQLSDIPDWAKPEFEENGTITNSTTMSAISRGASDTGFSGINVLYVSFVKVSSTTYRAIVYGGNANSSASEIEAFLYYLCS